MTYSVVLRGVLALGAFCNLAQTVSGKWYEIFQTICAQCKQFAIVEMYCLEFSFNFQRIIRFSLDPLPSKLGTATSVDDFGAAVPIW